MVGNFLADFIRPAQVLQLPEAIKQGVKIHHHIDAYTDQHADVKKSIHRMANYQGKYAPVVVDICYDYFLCKYWDLYYTESLEDFIAESYDTLQAHQAIFPESFRVMFGRMIKFDFLHSTMNRDRLVGNFEKLQTRVKFENSLHNAVSDLFFDLYDYETEFLDFYPELIQSTDTFITQNYR